MIPHMCPPSDERGTVSDERFEQVHRSSFIVHRYNRGAMFRKAVLALVLLGAVACGKRGDPHPPVPVIPKATNDLVVAQRGDNLILSWSFPSLTTAGQKLGAVRRVVVYRYVEELPVTQPPRDAKSLLPGDIDPTVPTSIALFAKVPPIGPQQFARLRQRVDSLDGSALPAATVGAKLVYEDSPPFHTTDGRPVRVNYAVVTEGRAAKSDVSNIATIVPVDVPVPPDALTATAKPEGVVLTWNAPVKSITGAEKPRVSGYNIYRMPKGEDIGLTSTPVNAAPVSQTTYTDVPPYGTQQYIVTAVAEAGAPRIESDPSAPAAAEFKDLVPPPTPTGLTALVETSAVRIVWDPVQAPDLAGYRVYRTEGIGIENPKISGTIPLTPYGPIMQTHLVDPGLEHGIAYYFEVSAVDKSGNESKRARTDWVVVPKNP
jgi:hypothetical protein